MEHTMIRTARAVLFATLFVFCWLVVPSASAHDGNSPHAIANYATSTDHLTFDKDADVGDGWGVVDKVNGIDANFFGMNLINGECENTSGPCMNVQEVCFPDAGWMFQYDTNYFNENPKHGRIRLNHCAGYGRDVSATCRSVMKVIGSHAWTDENNSTCLDDPWRLAVNHPNAADFSQLNYAYGVT